MHGLYAVENAGCVTCRGCKRPIDLWSPPGLRIEKHAGTNRATFTDIDPKEALCPECLIAAAPEEHRQAFAENARTQRLAIREAGIEPPVTTIVLRSTGNPALRWTQGFTLDMFTVCVRSWDPASKARPHITLTPDGSSWQPVSLVSFAVEVFHDDVPGAYVRHVWPFRDISRPVQVTIFGYENPDLTDAQLATLNKGRRFLRETVKILVGRPLGSRDRSRQDWIDAYRAHTKTLGQHPTQAKFLERMRTDRTTLRDNLTEYGLWPWSRFVSVASSARTISHR